ncbi:MAG: helix-turn-helix transcriptional regulator [Lachnospiraceae bacterium]|nr:helix-turn-helix transcriptional regulator [Lachnospiraceae bacterium]
MIQGLGDRLREQRTKIRISQKEAAIAIGVSASIISNYESGTRTPSLEALMTLANLYRCSTDYLLGLEKSPLNVLDTSMLSKEQLHQLQRFLSSLQE